MQFSTFLQTIRFVATDGLPASLGRCLAPDRIIAARDVASCWTGGVWPIFGEDEFTRFYYSTFLQDYVEATGLAVDPLDFARACILHYTVRLTIGHEAMLDLATLHHATTDAFALTHGDPAFSSVLYVPSPPTPDDLGARYRPRHPASGVTTRPTLRHPGDLRYICGSPRHLRARLGGQRLSTLVVSCELSSDTVRETIDLFLRELSADLFVLLIGREDAVEAMLAAFAAWFDRAHPWAAAVAADPRGVWKFAHLAVSPVSRREAPLQHGHRREDFVATRPLADHDRRHLETSYRYLPTRAEVAERADRAEILREACRHTVVPPKVLLAPSRFAEQMRGNFAADVDSWWRASFVDLPLAMNATFHDARLVGCGHCFTRDGAMIDTQMQEVSLPDLLQHAGVQRSDIAAGADGCVISRRAAETTEVVTQPAVCIGNGGLPMHAHFLLDVVGKLAFLGADGLADRLVLFPSIATPEQLDDVARVYDIPRHRLKVYDEHRGLQCKDLQMLPIAKMPPWLAPEMVSYLRRGLAKKHFPANLDPAACKRLFIGRGRVEGGPRRLLNEAELREVVLRDGFIDLEPSDYTLEQEIALFDNADEVIFIYGSACGNAVFCRPDARVLILQSDAMTEKTFGMVCGLLGMDYGYVFGSSFHRWHRGHNSDWLINPALVIDGLQQLRQ